MRRSGSMQVSSTLQLVVYVKQIKLHLINDSHFSFDNAYRRIDFNRYDSSGDFVHFGQMQCIGDWSTEIG